MDLNLFTWSLIIVAFLNILLGVQALISGPRRAQTYATFAISAGMGGWVGSYVLLTLTRNFFFDTLTHYSGLLFVYGLFLLSQVFPRRVFSKRVIALLSIPFVFAGLFVIPGGHVVESVSFTEGGAIVPVQGDYFPYFAGGLLIYLLGSLAFMVRSYLRERDSREKTSMRYLLIGILVFTLSLGVGDIFLPAIGFHKLNALGPLTSVFFAVMAGYALELEKRVRERTKALEEMRGRERMVMLDISHGLQTPLTIFQTKLESLKRSRPGDKEILGLENSLRDLSSYTYDLLKLARLEDMPKDADAEVFSLSDLVKGILEEVEIIASPQGIRVGSGIQEDLHVFGSAKKIEEAIMNVMSNAVKYTKTGEREIGVSLVRKGSAAVLVVKDGGKGLSPEAKNHMFERYFRTGSDEPGTGLGLAIAKQIVENAGGEIRLDSILGKGTTVSVSLPLSNKKV